ncbi:MAG: GrpB family protein [Gemmatimonadaceae bacterium]|nr:GrpB family protein [Gemmatimonadaceae bacterium]
MERVRCCTTFRESGCPEPSRRGECRPQLFASGTYARAHPAGGRTQPAGGALFRDYLRAAPSVRLLYDTVKRRAAALFPTNIKGYRW